MATRRYTGTVDINLDLELPEGMDREQERTWVEDRLRSALSAAGIGARLKADFERELYLAGKAQTLIEPSWWIESVVLDIEDVDHPDDRSGGS